ncbi:hypothetical protein FA95DRAFT_1664843 [Auriscalpium vulgare]|uniref:Uncharacterized protein n=1 Tax=Auriscalpium vulgare TaxID=40419 RepID=A0ACB8R3T2_9AGAM|nr:hypothetical protein FA95DRAFT_1664843 [Auriscalpium vulgare]
MVGRAKSIPAKRQKDRAERDMLFERAVKAYRVEQDKPPVDRKGLRLVCKMISEEYHAEKRRWVHLDHNTLAARLKGRQSLAETRESQSWLNEEETNRVIEYALEVAARGFPLMGTRR